MTRLKTDFQNCLGLTRLDACLQISKGVDLAYFNPDMAISIWHNEKNCHSTTTPHKHPKNRKQQNKPEKVLDVAKVLHFFFISRKLVSFSRYLDICVFVKATNFKICVAIMGIAT